MKKILIVEDELPIAELEKSIWHLSLLFRQKRKILIKSMD